MSKLVSVLIYSITGLVIYEITINYKIRTLRQSIKSIDTMLEMNEELRASLLNDLNKRDPTDKEVIRMKNRLRNNGEFDEDAVYFNGRDKSKQESEKLTKQMKNDVNWWKKRSFLYRLIVSHENIQ